MSDESSKFEVGKKYRHIHSPHLEGECVYSGVQVAVIQKDHIEYSPFQSSRGKWKEVKPKKVIEGWLNIYESKSFGLYPTKEEANKAASDDRIACIHIRHEYEGD